MSDKNYAKNPHELPWPIREYAKAPFGIVAIAIIVGLALLAISFFAGSS